MTAKNGKWKQSVFYYFYVNMSAVLFKQLIIELENIGIQIVAIVSDMDGKNSIICSELGVSHTKSPLQTRQNSSRHVFVFVDIPHLIKMLRKHYLNSGIILPSGKCVDKRK